MDVEFLLLVCHHQDSALEWDHPLAWLHLQDSDPWVSLVEWLLLDSTLALACPQAPLHQVSLQALLLDLPLGMILMSFMDLL
jgi:hypothetical protein